MTLAGFSRRSADATTRMLTLVGWWSSGDDRDPRCDRNFHTESQRVGGELPVVRERRLNEPVIAVIQPGRNPHPGQVSVTDDDTRGVQSVDTSRGTDSPPNRCRTRVMA